MRCGILLCNIINSLFKLSRWNLCSFVFNDKLLKLSFGDFSSVDWLHYMLCMYRWLILRHHRTNSSNRSVRCGLLLWVFIDSLLEMSCWNFCCFVFNDKLLKL